MERGSVKSAQMEVVQKWIDCSRGYRGVWVYKGWVEESYTPLSMQTHNTQASMLRNAKHQYAVLAQTSD